MKTSPFLLFVLLLLLLSCAKNEPAPFTFAQRSREPAPVLRDTIPDENYEAAGDAHVFADGDTLRMIYTGDADGKPAIKAARADALNAWSPSSTLLSTVGPSGLDAHKETGFYRKTAAGRHQIYYIGYDDENTYQAQIFLAEAEAFAGPYTQMNAPVVPRGTIAGKEVYCMTSPSVTEHRDTLFMTFIGWDNAPNAVTEVWVMGAISLDEGHTWTDFQLVDTRIGMEGQVTIVNDNQYIAVRTGDFGDGEAIFYATAAHPFGPWTEEENPILVQAGPPFEKDEIIAPQLFIEPATGEEFLFYTGADYDTGWWIMMARE